MLPSLLLGGALALGQPPELPDPPRVPTTPTQGVGTELPPSDPRSAPVPTITIEVPPIGPEEETPRTAPAPPDRWALMRALQGTWNGAVLDDNRLSVSGWMGASFTGSTDRASNLPLGLNYLANVPEVQQNWLRVERTVDRSASAPTWGFRSDTILPGTDYRFTIARGLFDNQLTANNGTPNRYGVDPVQFYGELYLPDVGRGLDVKFGRFFSQYGAESVDTTQNYFVSRSYDCIYNPFTHTGLLTTLKLTNEWSVQNGLVAGSDVFLAPESNPTYIGSVKWAPPDGRDSALFSVIVGKGRYDSTHAFSNPEVFDLVCTHHFSDRLTYTVDATYTAQTGVPNMGFVNSWAVVQYLSCQFAPKLSATVRLEFFDDVQGFKTGFKGLYTAVTTGITYRATPALWFRPELRYDTNAESRPFEGRPSLFTAAFTALVRW
jgi:hypothetical protein